MENIENGGIPSFFSQTLFAVIYLGCWGFPPCRKFFFGNRPISQISTILGRFSLLLPGVAKTILLKFFPRGEFESRKYKSRPELLPF